MEPVRFKVVHHMTIHMLLTTSEYYSDTFKTDTTFQHTGHVVTVVRSMAIFTHFTSSQYYFVTFITQYNTIHAMHTLCSTYDFVTFTNTADGFKVSPSMKIMTLLPTEVYDFKVQHSGHGFKVQHSMLRKTHFRQLQSTTF
jgi:hypothetical protein